jgi:hypothetical protein
MKLKRKTGVMIKPKNGLIMRDPDDGLKLIPETGKKVVWSSFWIKRAAAGEIEIIDEIKTAPKKVEEPKIEKKKNKKDFDSLESSGENF